MSSPIIEWKKERETRLFSGRGNYIDDIEICDMAYCVFLGSPHAHAKIKSIDVSEAMNMPGVIKVLQGKDLVNMTDPLPANVDYRSQGWHWRLPKAYPLATDKVRFIGEPVVAVIADDMYKAHDALRTIKVEYETLAAVTDAESAMQPGSLLLYDDWGDNLQAHLYFKFGDVDAAFSEADRKLNVSWREGRVSGFPIEPRGCVASYDSSSGMLKVWSSTQSPLLAQRYMAQALRLPMSRVQVIAPDIGGGFGNKINWSKEVVACLASILTGRAVRWFENRRENFATGPHQRDVIWDGEVAFNNDGRILAVKARFIVDVGVEGTNRGAGASSVVPACSALPNAYKLKALQTEAFAVVTNKSFYCAYRGFGKDKGIKFMERIINLVSRELNLPPEEVRFRNFIQPNEFPYKQITGYVYDSGDYPQVLKKALDMIEIDKWRKKKASKEPGKYLGIGVAFTVEPAGGAIPNSIFSGVTIGRVKIAADGKAEVYSDQTEIGQGSRVVIATTVSEILGIDIADVFVQPFTSDVNGAGPWSSRGVVYPLSAVAKAAKELRGRIVKVASKMLSEDSKNIEIKNGIIFSTVQNDKKTSMKDLAGYCYFFPGPRGLAKELQTEHETILDVSSTWFSPNTAQNPTCTYTTFCSSADIAVVEVDALTGDVDIVKYVHVHDAGRLMNKQIVDGQVHGGIVQGIGEALGENLVYDERGRLLSASFTDYMMPTALDAPNIELGHVETLSPFTELGTKGMGEAPIIGSKVAIINAIEDALAPFNVVMAESPATKESVWKLISKAKENSNR